MRRSERKLRRHDPLVNCEVGRHDLTVGRCELEVRRHDLEIMTRRSYLEMSRGPLGGKKDGSHSNKLIDY